MKQKTEKNLFATGILLVITGVLVGFFNPVYGFSWAPLYPYSWYGTVICVIGLSISLLAIFSVTIRKENQ